MIIVCPLILISWGPTGHKAIGLIAERHLTPATKLAIKNILGGETLPGVANYADELRSDPEYRNTGSWHYADVQPGDNFEQFAAEIKNHPGPNVYKMVLVYEKVLKNPDASRSEKATAIKFLVHFIGDLHQPMHVSNAADRGGNQVSVKFNGMGDNLHSLWDSGLIDRQGLNYKEMAVTYDTATPAQINKWQHDDLMVWLWESYQISSILYQEAANNPDIDDEYYKAHLPVLQKQIEKAGIRLAGVLNGIFDAAK